MKDKSKAVIFMLISGLAFALMAANVKLADEIPVFEKVFFRNMISLFVAFAVILGKNQKIFGKGVNGKFLFLRSFFGLIGVVLYFYSISHMNLADSSMLNKFSPFFVTLFACLFLKEKLTGVKIISLIIAFLAVMLIIKPRFELSVLPAVAGFFSAVFAGAAYTIVRFLGKRENPEVIVFYFSLISVLGMLPPVIMNFHRPTISELIYLIGSGLFAAIGQFALTFAYKFAKASEIAIYNYSNIIFSAILGYFIWKEVSDVYSILGGFLLIATSTWIYFATEHKKI